MALSLTIGELLREGSQQLAAAGFEDARLEAEVLLAYALGIERTKLYIRLHDELDTEHIAAYRRLVESRLSHEPVAYIVGHREFFGLDFYVDRGVLIPRPETELLVEQAIALAQKIHGSPCRIADVGTGSGAIAVSLAVHLPGAIVYAIDSSPRALAVAEQNIDRHGVKDRVQLQPGNLLEPLSESVEIIVANLPYIPTSELANLSPDVRCFEPLSALDGGPDGLDAYRELLRQAPAKLASPGHLLMEIEFDQGSAIVALVKHYRPEADVRVIKDYAGKDRVAIV